MKTDDSSTLPTSFGFLLINDFTLLSMSSAVEPLRMANRVAGEHLYRWRTVSESGEAVTASDGLSVNVDYSINDPNVLSGVDAIIVCGGRRVQNSTTNPILRWLRSASQAGIGLGATCTGSYVLAEAGLLDGYRCSVHWENIASVADLFPRVNVSRTIYTIDRDRYTSSGGTAPVDLMLSLIRRRLGAPVSSGIAEQFVHERMRESTDLQRIPLRHTVGNQSEKLIVAVELMEANLKEPISQTELASYVGLSRRQMQRLFQRYLVCSPSQHYVQIRLARARELLHQTRLSLVEISSLTGFTSTSQFSKSFRKFYGHSPSEERSKSIS